MASRMVIHKKSAISWPVKRSTLVSEVFRRLHNTDATTTWQDKAGFISELVVKMFRSGYSNEDIVSFVKGGVAKFEKLETLAAEGARPLYRDRHYKDEERWHKKLTNKFAWSQSDAVLFLPLSAKLKEVAKESINRTKENIKVVEMGGTNIKQLLQRSDPNKDPLCKDLNCWTCQCQDGGQKNLSLIHI